MPEPLSIVGGVASILQIISSVTKLAKALNEVRESYNNISLNITLVASQLSTIRAALEALHTWRSSDTIETGASKQLDQDLGLSLSCCAILITVIDGKLNESGYKAGWGKTQKIKYLWLEDILKEYVSNLEGQVRALQLLLTIFQCRTATEQKQQLARAESRSIIEQVRAETMTLGVEETDIDDAMSILSHDPSVHLDVDSILMKSPAYKRVYGERELSRGKKAAGPPPPPPPRRKPAAKLSPLSIEAKAQAIPASSEAEPLPQPPAEPALQPSPHPPEIASQPPAIVPPRPKGPSQPRQTQPRNPSQEQPGSQGRINVWDFLGSGEEGKGHGNVKLVNADSAPVFELPAAPEPMNITQAGKVDIEWLKDAVAPSDTSSQAELSHQHSERSEIPESSATSSTAEATNDTVDPRAPSSDTEVSGKLDLPSYQTASLEGLRTQSDHILEVRKPPELRGQDRRHLLSPYETSDAISISDEMGALPPWQYQTPSVADLADLDPVDASPSDNVDGKSQSPQPVSKTLSTHSNIDLYDASVRNIPLEEPPRPSSSHPPTAHDATTTATIASKDDELAAETEGLSILNQQLAAKHSDIEQPIRDHVGKPELETKVTDLLGQSPQITMTPSEDHLSGQAVDLSTSSGQQAGTPASPTRAPPVPPIPAPFIPSIPISSPPFIDAVERGPAMEMSTASSRRDSSVFEVSSTISSSEPSVNNTIPTLQKSTSNTTATSISTNGPGAAREQAQAELRRLQSELTAAKTRGDTNAAQDSLQKSIEVIRRTYLAGPSQVETQIPPSLRGRKSFSKRFPSFTSSADGSALNDAATAGDLSRVKMLLDTKVNVDARSKAYMTPLMLAAMNGHVECLELLKQRGADESAVDAKGRTVLHLAVASGQSSTVKWLLTSYPPNRPQVIKHRNSILFKATDSLMARPLKNLREASDAEGSKPLHIAAASANVGILNTLLANGVDIESKNNWSRTPLLQAIISNRRASFDILLRAGANINALDARMMAPLHWAAKTGHADMIETLLVKGASRNDYDSDGNQPMHQAAWVGKISGIESLLVECISLEVRTRAGESLLHIACLTKNLELATYLLKTPIEVNPWATPQPTLLENLSKFKVPLTSLTPLQYACCKGDYEMTILLRDHEAWINAATPEGVTALMMAVESEDTNTVNLLLSRGAKVNASMPGSLRTALHIASRRGDLETVQQLCRAGADRQARTNGGSGNYGRTPAEEAGAKCTDKVKRAAVEEYFQTIRMNVFKNARVRAMEARRSHEMVGNAYMMPSPSLDVQPAQPVSYAPWGPDRNNLAPIQGAQYGLQQPWPATYPSYSQQAQMQMSQVQMSQQWYDPDPLTHVESPPPYVAGSSVSARLAAQAPVHRPSDSTEPK